MSTHLIALVLAALCVFSGCIDPPDPPETDYVTFDDITPEQVASHRHILVDGTLIQYLREEDTGALFPDVYRSVFRGGDSLMRSWGYTDVYVFSDKNGDTMEIRFPCGDWSHLIGKPIRVHAILCGEYGERGEGVYLKAIEGVYLNAIEGVCLKSIEAVYP